MSSLSELEKMAAAAISTSIKGSKAKAAGVYTVFILFVDNL